MSKHVVNRRWGNHVGPSLRDGHADEVKDFVLDSASLGVTRLRVKTTVRQPRSRMCAASRAAIIALVRQSSHSLEAFLGA